MESVVLAIAAICQVHGTGNAVLVEQLKCSSALAECVIEATNHKDKAPLLECVARLRAKHI